MDKRLILHTELEVSALCYGTATFGSGTDAERATAMINAFRDAGGNFLDTAHVYGFWAPQAGAGASERALAEYFARNGGRDEMIVATKGGHPARPKYPRGDRFLSPDQVHADLTDSLRWLRAEMIDLYWLHRDDPRVAAGEVIETLNAEVRRGLIRCLGASNWAPARIAEANAYAAAHGLAGFVASQPQWSLAHCPPAALADPTTLFLGREDVSWHARTKLPVIPYTSTAGGFFATGRSRKHIDNNVSRARLARARRLGEELGFSPNQVALAYLMCHDFPVFPTIGTTDLAHLADAVGATDIRLSGEQVAWLRDGLPEREART